MELIIEKYHINLKYIWNKFVINSINGTFLHNMNFYEHNSRNLVEDNSILIYEKEKLIGVLPGNIVINNNKKIFNSHNRSTYGGLIIAENLNTSKLVEIFENIKNYFINIDVEKIIIRPVFSIYSNDYYDKIAYAMFVNGFTIINTEIEYAIKLDNNFNVKYSNSNIRNIKKAQKNNLEIYHNKSIPEYWVLLEKNLTEKHGTKPVHTIDEINYLIELVGNDKVELVTIHLGKKIIAGILIFLANKDVAHAQYIASDMEYQEYRPLNLLIDYIAKWSHNNGFKYFNLGMASEPNQRKLNNGLANFKEGFGAIGFLRNTFEYKC